MRFAFRKKFKFAHHSSKGNLRFIAGREVGITPTWSNIRNWWPIASSVTSTSSAAITSLQARTALLGLGVHPQIAWAKLKALSEGAVNRPQRRCGLLRFALRRSSWSSIAPQGGSLHHWQSGAGRSPYTGARPRGKHLTDNRRGKNPLSIHEPPSISGSPKSTSQPGDLGPSRFRRTLPAGRYSA